MKRGYATRKPKPRSRRRIQYLLDWVPPALMRQVKAKSRRSGVSVREKLLATLERWVRT
jgi:hypothetical protein